MREEKRESITLTFFCCFEIKLWIQILSLFIHLFLQNLINYFSFPCSVFRDAWERLKKWAIHTNLNKCDTQLCSRLWPLSQNIVRCSVSDKQLATSNSSDVFEWKHVSFPRNGVTFSERKEHFFLSCASTNFLNSNLMDTNLLSVRMLICFSIGQKKSVVLNLAHIVASICSRFWWKKPWAKRLHDSSNYPSFCILNIDLCTSLQV